MTGVQTCALPICFPVTIDHVAKIEEITLDYESLLRLSADDFVSLFVKN